MSYGEIDVQLDAVAELAGSSTEDEMPPVFLPGGSRDRAEVFVTPGVVGGPNWSWAGFAAGRPTHHPDEAFASAQMDGRGFADLGVSGRSEGPGADSWGYLLSTIFARQRVTNIGGDGLFKLEYTIPLIEIAHRGNQFDGLVSIVNANLLIHRYDKDGKFVEDLQGFNYTLQFDYTKPPTDYAIQTFTMSPDLRRDSRGWVDTECGANESCTGKSVQPFSVSRILGDMDAGDYLEYTYFMSAEFVTGNEGGGHALYGDPLAFGAEGDRNFFEFSAVDDTAGAVPEPASGALLGLALAALAWRPRAPSRAAPHD
jgi:PEP-CTERM motif